MFDRLAVLVEWKGNTNNGVVFMRIESVIRLALWSTSIVVPLVILFLWQVELDYNESVDAARFGTFGDFIGGVLGSFWSLCGVLIFYSALKEQRIDFKTNKDALLKQTEALELQIDEFRLQRDELVQSRQVFIEQSKTFKQQRMASTYFALLDLYRKIVDGLNSQCSEGNYFKTLRKELLDNFLWCEDPVECHRNAKRNYVDLYYSRKEELSHYYKIIYRIFKVVDDSDLDEADKFQYITILRSQLSENEMLAIYYNSHSPYGEGLYRFILRYNFLKHLSSVSKPEFKGHLSTFKQYSDLLDFNNQVFSALVIFIDSLGRSVRDEGFQEEKISFLISSQAALTLSIRASEINELYIELSSSDKTEEYKVFEYFALAGFACYLKAFLYDIFICSRYEKDNALQPVDFDVSDSCFSFRVASQSALRLNIDNDGVYNV